MKKSTILLTAQIEFGRHSWQVFPVDFNGEEGTETIQVLGCPRCRRNLATIEQYNEHLKNDVLPPIVELILNLGKSKA
jgi:hypothetical protein